MTQLDRQPRLCLAAATSCLEIFGTSARISLAVPDGVSYRFTGTYENQLRSQKRLVIRVPLALAVIFMLLYLPFRRTSTALMVFSGMAFAASGGFYLIWLYGRPWFADVSRFGIDIRDLFSIPEEVRLWRARR